MASTLARSGRGWSTSRGLHAASSNPSTSSTSSARLAAVRASSGYNTPHNHDAAAAATSYRLFSSSSHRMGLGYIPMASRGTQNKVDMALYKGKNAARKAAAKATNDGTTEPIYRRQRREAEKAERKKAKAEKKAKSLAAQMGLNKSKLSPLVRIDRQFKTFKPITSSIRWLRYNVNPHLHKGDPIRSLTVAKRGTGGRNHHGHITVRGRGGGHKRRLRMIDWWRHEAGQQTVIRIEYDPGRSAHIALVRHNESGRVSYVLAPDGLRAGDEIRSYRHLAQVAKKPKAGEAATESEQQPAVQNAQPGSEAHVAGATSSSAATPANSSKSGADAALDMGVFRTQALRPGNVLPLHLIPVGSTLHALSLVPHGPAKLLRSAGSSGRLIAFVNRSQEQKNPSSAGKPANSADSLAAADQAAIDAAATDSGSEAGSPSTTHAQIRLQSGEVRLVSVNCVAAIGRVSNIDHKHRRLGKAGRSRWLGRRPKVRGVAMNKVDHPHGGGRGKSKSNMHPKSIYGHKAEGRTRKPGTKRGNKMVVKERPRQLGARKNK